MMLLHWNHAEEDWGKGLSKHRGFGEKSYEMAEVTILGGLLTHFHVVVQGGDERG